MHAVRPSSDCAAPQLRHLGLKRGVGKRQGRSRSNCWSDLRACGTSAVLTLRCPLIDATGVSTPDLRGASRRSGRRSDGVDHPREKFWLFRTPVFIAENVRRSFAARSTPVPVRTALRRVDHRGKGWRGEVRRLPVEVHRMAALTRDDALMQRPLPVSWSESR